MFRDRNVNDLIHVWCHFFFDLLLFKIQEFFFLSTVSIPTLNDDELIDDRIQVMDMVMKKELTIVGEGIDDLDWKEMDGNILKIQKIKILLNFELLRPKRLLNCEGMLIFINLNTSVKNIAWGGDMKKNFIEECACCVNEKRREA
jgi:hypothetical protein